MRVLLVVFCIAGLWSTQAALADDSVEIELEDGRFSEERITMPSNVKTTLEIENESNQTIEFFIPSLDIQLGVPADSERELVLEPLKAGEYPFENALDSSAKGVLVVE